MRTIQRTKLFDFDFTVADTLEDVVAAIEEQIAASQPGIDLMITPNASTTVYYNKPRYRHLKEFYKHAGYIMADGMPIVWLSKLKPGTRSMHRLPGSNLFPLLWGRIKARQWPATMVVSSERLKAAFAKDYDHVTCIVPRYFDSSEENYIRSLAREAADNVMSTNAHFVFLGLNFPKQEKLGMYIHQYLTEDNYRKPVLIALLGASFGFYFNMKKRAPLWMQQSGLEWFFRFMQEPKRLWKRYTVDSARFILLAIKELFRR